MSFVSTAKVACGKWMRMRQHTWAGKIAQSMFIEKAISISAPVDLRIDRKIEFLQCKSANRGPNSPARLLRTECNAHTNRNTTM